MYFLILYFNLGNVYITPSLFQKWCWVFEIRDETFSALGKAHDLVMVLEKEIWVLFIINKYSLSTHYTWDTSANKTDNDPFSWSLYSSMNIKSERINMKIINDMILKKKQKIVVLKKKVEQVKG